MTVLNYHPKKEVTFSIEKENKKQMTVLKYHPKKEVTTFSTEKKNN